jgi:hypothetical protein
LISRSSHRQKGTQVNHTTGSARTPFLQAGVFAALGGVFGDGGGSGAGFSGETAPQGLPEPRSPRDFPVPPLRALTEAGGPTPTTGRPPTERARRRPDLRFESIPGLRAGREGEVVRTSVKGEVR